MASNSNRPGGNILEFLPIKKIENGVVDSYKKIEDGVVDGFNKVADGFVEKYLLKEDETVEEAKARLAKELEERGNK